MSEKRKIMIDCDPGTDDSVCIIMALTHPDVELLGITTESGNLPADKTAANALKILEYMDRGDIPVAQGMMHPMLREYPKDPYSHCLLYTSGLPLRKEIRDGIIRKI